MNKEVIINALSERFEFDQSDIEHTTNLFAGTIDSLDFLVFAKTIGKLAEDEGLNFDMKDFLYSERYSIDEIFQYVESLSKKT